MYDMCSVNYSGHIAAPESIIPLMTGPHTAPEGADRVIVIGAGIAGLAAAARLAQAGLNVTVLERHATPGGKMRTLPSPAGPVDAGPTVLTMRPVFDELFSALGGLSICVKGSGPAQGETRLIEASLSAASSASLNSAGLATFARSSAASSSGLCFFKKSKRPSCGGAERAATAVAGRHGDALRRASVQTSVGRGSTA